MATTIQISKELQEALNKKKLYNRETYEEVIWDIMEDTMELNDQTIKEISDARARIKKGDYITLEQAKKKLGF